VGILEQHWNGTQLKDLNTMLQWAQSSTWKGIHPIIVCNQKLYAKGISLSKTAMREIEKWALLNRDMKFVGAIPCGCPLSPSGQAQDLSLQSKIILAFSNA
jgi:hypothetical protein